MFTLPALIIAAGLVVVAGMASGQALLARRRVSREAILSDPENYIRARFNQDEAPRQQELRRKRDAAREETHREADRQARVEKELPDVPPKLRHVIFTSMIGSLWVGAFVAQCWLDYRIAYAVTGNGLSAGLITLVVAGALAATTLTAARLWEGRGNRTHPARTRTIYALAMLLATFAAILGLLAVLAPKRAELDYQDSILTARQTIAMYEEDQDSTAVDYARAKLATLEDEKAQAASFYQAATVVAGALEGGSSLIVPSAIILLSYCSSVGATRRKNTLERQADEAIARSGERFMVRIAREMERAGVPQNQLQSLVGRATNQSPQEAAPAVTRPPLPIIAPAPPHADDANPETAALQKAVPTAVLLDEETLEAQPLPDNPDMATDPTFDLA